MNHVKWCVFLWAACALALAQSPAGLGERVEARPNPTAQKVMTGTVAGVFASPLAAGTAQADTVPGSTTYALPQLAFGGGWYTALYISNPTDAAAAVSVNFVGNDGAPLSVPLIGIGPVSEQAINLAPRATVILEAPDSGALQQGWTQATLASGLVCYGVFRQSISGRADQEAVVPLGVASSQIADLTWDDTAFTTAVALVNTGDSAADILIEVFASDGTSIGTTTVNLAGRGKTAFVLREQPGLVGMTSKRGFARFSVTSGSLAVLGLRFGGSAFTSIPVTYR